MSGILGKHSYQSLKISFLHRNLHHHHLLLLNPAYSHHYYLPHVASIRVRVYRLK
jgi:hypothetical protein